ncbi:hypothetical protein KBY97_00500 [Synechococcus sp. ATX 2A4]|uniref:hypothetical protein n=1 Tax=Synechococcus sp. ATX 2A4 TaxID=2823727 RepID=UPI0020CBE297|nr:hypothetical protein [Synechococcus sp. ATX 2A4]MCP9883606.1 hypothetical protein [Synechococcus sp. ATX 2A4]
MITTPAPSNGPQQPDKSLIPLVLGVVGHRDPIQACVPQVVERFKEDLRQLLHALPHTPILMLNGLATGMDSMAAEVFLEMAVSRNATQPHAPLHHLLVAALPQHPNRYRIDFKPEEQDRFDHLLMRCHAVLHPGNCAELRGEAAPGEDLPSPDCYGRQGIFLVRHAYLVAAFFNGGETMEMGGTGQTIALQKGEVHPLFLNVDEVVAAREPGAMIEYHTPRHKNAGNNERPARAYWLETKAVNQLDATLKLPAALDRINASLLASPATISADAPVQSMLWRHVDQQAVQGKQRFLLCCYAFVGLGGSIGFLLTFQPYLVAGLLTILLAAVIFPKLQRKQKQAFIENRCLAEALTVQQFWSEMEVEADVADLFRTQTNTNMAWIRMVLRSKRLQLIARLAGFPGSGAIAPVSAVRRWLEEQVHWLAITCIRYKRCDSRCLWIAGLAYAGALASAIFIARQPTTQIAWLPEFFFIIFVLSLGFRELMGYADMVTRYTRSREQFERGLQAIQQAMATNSTEQQRTMRLKCAVEAVGREKIDELNDWVTSQLQRVYKPVS